MARAEIVGPDRCLCFFLDIQFWMNRLEKGGEFLCASL